MPTRSSDKAPTILFLHFPQLMQFDDTTSAPIHNHFPTNISHLTQTFLPGCYLCCRQYVIDTNKVTLCGSHFLCQSKITHGPNAAEIWIILRGRAAERADISPTNTQIDLRVTEPTVIWLTSDTIKWEREGTEDHHYINHLSFPRLPLWIICAHHLMGFVCSQTNFTVNITIMPPEFTPTQIDDDRKTKRSREAGRDKDKQKINDYFHCFYTEVQRMTLQLGLNTKYSSSIFVHKGTCVKVPSGP